MPTLLLPWHAQETAQNATAPPGKWTAQLSSEAATLFLAVDAVGNATAATADECKAACADQVECLAWAWCPVGQAGGCTAEFGTTLLPPATFGAGECILTGDDSPTTFSMFLSKGPGVPFTSGVRTFDPTWSAPGAAEGTGGAAGEGAGAGCAELPAAKRTCGAQALYAYAVEAAPPQVDEYVAAAAAVFGRDRGGLACTPGQVRLACRNSYSPTSFFVAFDADCGTAGKGTIEARALREPAGLGGRGWAVAVAMPPARTPRAAAVLPPARAGLGHGPGHRRRRRQLLVLRWQAMLICSAALRSFSLFAGYRPHSHPCPAFHPTLATLLSVL